MATKKSFYAVAAGRVPGIYSTWAQARSQVDGFAGARFKGFATRGEAAAWLAAPESRRTPVKAGAGAGAGAGKGAGAGAATDNGGKSGKELPIAPVAGEVVIYTDGGAINNPGPGGYGIVQLYNGQRKELSGGYRRTTNNRMELMACIVALRELEHRDRQVCLYSDSSYVVNGITKGWARGWRQRGWLKADRQPALNPDLWGQLLDLVEQLQVSFHWVRGHNGNPLNERCDQLAVTMARAAGLPVDAGYESLKGQE